MHFSFKIEFFAFIILICESQTRDELSSFSCHRDEQYFNSTVSPICDVNCQDLSRNCGLTSTAAIAGCYCRRGFARNLQQRCIPTSQCPFDCFPNERPIRPISMNCENICALATNIAPTINCYRSEEMRCVCMRNCCRNQNGQCVQI